MESGKIMERATIQRLVQSINLYLDCKQRADWLWEQIEMHLRASYIAECLGDTEAVPKHLGTVAFLLLEANQAQEAVHQHCLPSPLA